jgi:hypothetical protein
MSDAAQAGVPADGVPGAAWPAGAEHEISGTEQAVEELLSPRCAQSSWAGTCAQSDHWAAAALEQQGPAPEIRARSPGPCTRDCRTVPRGVSAAGRAFVVPGRLGG